MPSVTHYHNSSAPAAADASLTTRTQASQLREGGYVMIKNNPCRITEIRYSQPRKHGHLKAAIRATDIFTSKQYEELSRGHLSIDVPIVTRKEYLVLDIDGGYLSLWNSEKGEPEDDVKVPEGEVGEKVVEMWKKDGMDVWVMVLAAMGMEMVEGVREAERE